MTEESDLRTPARLESLVILRSYAAEHARRFGCSERRVREIALAVEEVLTNIFAYAYGGNAGGEVVMACREIPGDTLEIRISDSGRAFNPAAAPPPVFAETVRGRIIGGMGIPILRRYADGVSYERVEGRNILTISVTRKHATE